MKGQLLNVIFFLLGLGKSFAQLNESDTAKFQLRTSVTGNYQQGNVEVLNIKSKIDFSFSPHKNWVIKSQYSSLYQAFYSAKADNDIFSRNYIYCSPQKKVYPFGIAYISTNYRRKIDTRYFAGAGITWQSINTKNTVVKFSASTVYENTKFTANNYNFAEYNGDKNINLWRGTLYAGGWSYLLEKHIRLYYDAYWQPAFNNSNNYRTQIDIGADFPIWKGLSFNALYAFTHENVVIEKVIQEDKILTFGIAYLLKVR
ncbi:MAG TPA: DUF481 domain-containing protein [Panacibacter sp.]|nr:DUF481 domain-containing protein [Panacibacter sp.]